MTTLNCGVMDRLSLWIWMLTLPCLFSLDGLSTDIPRYGHVFPYETLAVEIGKEFTATCVLNDNAGDATVQDLYWTLGDRVIPEDRYRRVNATALNVTVTVDGLQIEWLICHCRKYLPMLSLDQPYSIQGIPLVKKYFPEKPENLSCVAVQSGRLVSSVLRCTWAQERRDSESNYTLFAKPDGVEQVSAEGLPGRGSVQFDSTFPHSFVLDVWVEARNPLGVAESDHLVQDAETFVKPRAPLNATLISEKSLSKSLLLKWNHPIKEAYLKLHYQVRYCPSGSALWTQVPQEDTSQYIQSFRLQSLLSDTEYVAQVRCQGNWPTYWSDWTQNVTARTPEDKPSSKPDLWRIIRSEGAERKVELLCKPPLRSNGRIRSYRLKVTQGGKQEDWRSVPLNVSEGRSVSASEREISDLGELALTERENAVVRVIAQNSAGSSGEGVLVIPRTGHEPFEGVQWVQCGNQRGQLWVEWRPPVANPRHNVSEYIVEWRSVGDDGRVDWQREPVGTNRTAIEGELARFLPYAVQVHPVYNGRPGRPAGCQGYREEAAPSAAPSVGATKRWATEVQLDWKEIPLPQRRGFITNYTLFIASAARTLVIPLSSDTYGYKVTHLERNTKYLAHVMASNSQGSYNGTLLSFRTEQYGEWELEGIVVGSCFSFLAVVVLTMLICVAKKDLVRKAFWPHVPDPSESTIAAWSPDFPSKAASPKESVLGSLSVVEVFEGDSLSEDDKASLPPKDKDLSGGEHSSGIGGSSCMSSPRQSVSDSEEGGDGGGGGSGQTTASTVQYSSVVASSGYKGQSPRAPPAPPQTCFARSESTQPLLDGEERPPDTPVHAPPKTPSFRRLPGDGEAAGQLEMEPQGGGASLKFSPLEEGRPQITPIEEELPPEWQASASNYRSQANGYRPQ